MRQGHPDDPSKDSYEVLKLNLDRIGAAVEGEYAENDRRLNWFLLFQAFLFQAYATFLQSITGASSHEAEIQHARAVLVIVVLVGLATSALTVLATRAGIRAIEWLKRERETVMEDDAQTLGIKNVGFPVTGHLHRLGLLPTRVGPWIPMVAWLWILVSSLSNHVFRLM